MSKGINQSDLWCIIKSLLDQDDKTYLIKHHIESFNDFIENKIPLIISQQNPLSIFHEYNSETNKYKYEIVINFVNSRITKPYINENDGSTKPMYPSDARFRNMSYSSSLFIDLEILTWLNPMDEDKSLICKKEIKNINIGKIPIMVNSKYCLLKNNKQMVDYFLFHFLKFADVIKVNNWSYHEFFYNDEITVHLNNTFHQKLNLQYRHHFF